MQLHRVGIESTDHCLEFQMESAKILCSRQAQLDNRHEHMFAYW